MDDKIRRQSPVLYVEPNDHDVLFLKRAFQEAGIPNRLVSVSSAKDAVAYLTQAGLSTNGDRAPCLVLLDWHLPRISGLEMLRWIRRHSPLKNMPVVVYTSSGHPQDVGAAYAAGANGFLVKSSQPADWASHAAAIRDFWLIHNVWAGAPVL